MAGRLVAEFQWWLLIVGIVAGGGLVAVVFMEGSRLDWDVAEDERRAEATWISEWLARKDPAPAPNRYGTTGTAAPIANATNEPPAAPRADPSWSGSSPSSSRTSVSRAC